MENRLYNGSMREAMASNYQPRIREGKLLRESTSFIYIFQKPMIMQRYRTILAMEEVSIQLLEFNSTALELSPVTTDR